MSTSPSPRSSGTLRLRPREQVAVPPCPAPEPAEVAALDPAEIAARKQANVQREREAQAAAVVRRRQQTREMLDVLRARWPEVFSAPVPLAIGIAHEIRAALGEMPLSKMRLSQALHYWTHGRGYLVAVEAGQRRMHLDGSDAGEPDEAARQYARDILAQRAARRRAG